MKKNKLLLLLTLPVLLMGCTRGAVEPKCNFVMSFGSRVTWHALPVELWLDPTYPQDYLPALNASISSYNAIRPFFHLNGYQTTGSSHNRLIVAFASWRRASNEEANTQIDFVANDIYNANVYINNVTYGFRGETNKYQIDLQSLLTHELGHVLGLAHVDDPTSVMFPYLYVNQLRRSLSVLDINDLLCGYVDGD